MYMMCVGASYSYGMLKHQPLADAKMDCCT